MPSPYAMKEPLKVCPLFAAPVCCMVGGPSGGRMVIGDHPVPAGVRSDAVLQGQQVPQDAGHPGSQVPHRLVPDSEWRPSGRVFISNRRFQGVLVSSSSVSRSRLKGSSGNFMGGWSGPPVALFFQGQIFRFYPCNVTYVMEFETPLSGLSCA